nr:EAL domain-containing protein [Wenzhouxiangella sp. XN24]
MLMPGDFLGLADEIGMSDRLGDWVMRTACAQLAAWDRAGLPPIAMSVNVAPAQFSGPGFVDSVSRVLAASDLDPRRLELEILEQTAVDRSQLTVQALARLREIGVQIALDDFGTGYSSLVYLTQLPANILKLDRAFIRTLATDVRQAAMVGAIISLGKRLDMAIVAEGVEDDAQRVLLGELGCDLMQGYLFSRPLPPKEFAALLLREEAGSDGGWHKASVAGQA